MRKLILSMFLSLDGYTSGPDNDMAWNTDLFGEDMEKFAFQQLSSVDTLVLGRRTYELFAGFWPDQTDEFGDMMNAATKVVFSRTLTDPSWVNSRVATSGPAKEINALKAQPGKDMLIYGSAELTRALLKAGVIDELRLWVHPTILGAGVPFLAEFDDHISLELTGTHVFDTGVVILYHRVVR